MLDSDQLRFERIESTASVNVFSCGNADLERFLVDDAVAFHYEKLATTYGCFCYDALVGYVAWVADCIRLSEEEKSQFSQNKALLHEFPSMKIARLAVRSDWQNKGIGSLLIRISFGHMLNWSKLFGCRFATVDAKPEALGFYEKHGFVKNLHKQEKSRHTVSMRFDLLHYSP